MEFISGTFFGKISMVTMYGIGSRPMQLEKTIHAKKNGGIHSNPGCLNQKYPYAANKKKQTVVINDDRI